MEQHTPICACKSSRGLQTTSKHAESQLNEITGFSGTSLQPNSGAQGDMLGLW